MKNKVKFNEKTLNYLILNGDMTEEEMAEYFKLTDTTKFEMVNGDTVSYRKDAGYVYISGGTGEESYELGITLYNAITKNAEKEMSDINSKSMKAEV